MTRSRRMVRWQDVARMMVLALAGPATLLAQAPAPAPAPAAAATAPAAADSAEPPPARPLSLQRASWLADRQPIRVGDLLTIVVDEQTSISERTSTVANNNRNSDFGLNANGVAGVFLGPQKTLTSSVAHGSNDVGQQSRDGNVVGTITVHVTELDDLGNAKISGSKSLTADGRKQEILIEGIVRPQDVQADNTVQSSRVADAEITFKGKKIAARKGILGGILSILWP